MTISICLDAVSVIGPGGSSWAEWKSILQDTTAYLATKTNTPVSNALPSAERRRTGVGVKLAIASGMQVLETAGIDPRTVTTVFSSSGGDGDNCHLICEALAGDDRMLSPTRFHNSVHNAPSGYWGIASGAMLPSTSLCAYDASFGSGLLEACTQAYVEKRPVLYVAYDTPYPEPLQGVRPISDQFAVGLLISPVKTDKSIACLSLALSKDAQTEMEDGQLERIRKNIPAARALPLLQVLARMNLSRPDSDQTEVLLEFVNRNSLSVKVCGAM